MPEPQESSRSPLFGWACRPKTSCLCATWAGDRLATLDEPQQFGGRWWSYLLKVLRAQSCQSGGLWLATGSCCAPEVNLVPGP